MNVVALNRKDSQSNINEKQQQQDNNQNINHPTIKDEKNISLLSSSFLRYIKRKEHFLNAGVQFNEIFISNDIEKDETQFGKMILKSVIDCNPDMVITESSIGKYSLFLKSNFSNLLMYRLNCPIIVVRDFSIPIVNIIQRMSLKIRGNMGPSYLVKLIQSKK